MTPLYIGPYEHGLEKNLTPFMIPEEAFPSLLNAFCFRGRIEKKPGNSLIGRLQRSVTTVTLTQQTSGAFTTTITDILNDSKMLFVNNNNISAGTIRSQEVNAQIAPSTLVITANAITFTDTTGTGILTSTAGNSGTVNYSTGRVVLTFAINPGIVNIVVTLSYFPTLPVMGLRLREQNAINVEQTVAFDTIYAYDFSGTTWQELSSTMPTYWTGTNNQFFWTTNYQVDSSNRDLFWATNFVAGIQGYAYTNATNANPTVVTVTIPAGQTDQLQIGDSVYFLNPNVTQFQFLSGQITGGATPNWQVTLTALPGAISASGVLMFQNHNVKGDGIRYYNGTTWTNFQPLIDANTALLGAQILIPYHGRLIALNTIEGNDPTLANVTNFRKRARWCQNGDSTDVINGWRSDISGRGGFADAATEETIVSCGIVKDQLIVYFERSTWQLTYTANQIQPFEWERINTELGGESTFSVVTFDNALICVGNVGIHSSNGLQVQRIDAVIPDEIFNFHNGAVDDGPTRVYGVRDFLNELVYFTFPNNLDNTNGAASKVFYPNNILAYNYRNQTFSLFDDNYTCYGYFQRANDLKWQDLTADSPIPTWASWNIPWSSGFTQAETPSVCAGNQQGFVMQIQDEDTGVAQSLTITNMVISGGGLILTITSPQFNLFTTQYVQINGALGITNVNGNIFKIATVIDENNFTIITSTPFTGTYGGYGKITVMTLLDITTKMFTPFWKQGKRYTLKYVDILVDATDSGEMALDIYINTSDTNSMTDPISNPSIMGNNIVSTSPETGINYQFQKYQAQIWKRFYTCVQGDTFQLQFSFNDAEMKNITINESDIVIHGMIMWFDASGEFL